eukprot:g5167.t1
MMHSLLGVLALAVFASGAAPKYASEYEPVSSSNVNGSVPVTITISFFPENESALENALMRISNPGNEQFRKYLRHEDVAELVAPSAAGLTKVLRWTKEVFGEGAGVTKNQHGDLIEIKTTAGHVANAFGVKMIKMRHTKLKSFTVVRASLAESVTPSTIVPSHLKEYVRGIFGVVEILPLTRTLVRQIDGSNSNGDPGVQVTPPVIFKQYNMTENDVGGKTGSLSQAVAAFEQAEFRPSDVSDFQKKFGLPPVIIGVNGPNKGGYFGEASLDTQYITASGRGVKSFFVAQDAFDMLSFCNKVLAMKPVPTVVSISWGSGESAYPADHMDAASACFQKLGTMGTSIFAASGDQGTNKQGFWACKKFDPTWPASSPFLTAVGGTYIDSGSHVENGWSLSGGGFSAFFKRPSYQEKTVDGYLNSSKVTLPNAKYYSADGRATPDISAVATNFLICSGGCDGAGTLTGTSAATPTVAGMVSVINDKLAEQGKPPVGFINPLIYGHNVGFDVLTGNNKASGCPTGFQATEGWDPVTGVGTPLFPVLKDLLMNPSLQ